MPTVQDIRARAGGDEPITMLTAYDAPTAGIVDEAGIDVALVGDSMGNATLGYDSTLPVTVEEVASATGAVARGADEALVVSDMPFLSTGVEEAESVANAGRMVKQEGADAVKIESGPHTVGLTERLVHLGIPVMAHVGFTPQRVKEFGGYGRQGTTDEDAAGILQVAEAHESAGAFSVVVEHVPTNLAAAITDRLSIPTIGIGAGPHTDGQVLVVTDVVGLTESVPPFAEEFGDVRGEMQRAVEAYRDAVRDGAFPTEEHGHAAEDLELP